MKARSKKPAEPKMPPKRKGVGALTKITQRELRHAAEALAIRLSPPRSNNGIAGGGDADAPRARASARPSRIRTAPAHGDELARNGFVHLRGAIPPALVEALRVHVYGAMGALGVVRKRGGDPTSFRTSSSMKEVDDLTAESSFIEQTTRSKPFDALMLHCRLHVLPTVACGPLRLKHDRHARWLRLGLPGRDAPRLPPHQDVLYLHPDSAFLTVWVPLHDCPRELGGLRVVPGSHRRGPLLHDGLRGRHGGRE